MLKETLNKMPYNLEAEQSLLGSILIDLEMQFEIASKLKTDYFYVESHKLIFDTITSVLLANKPVDLVTLSDAMNKTSGKVKKKNKVNISTLAEEMEKRTILERAGGIEYLMELARVTPSAANYEYYLGIVKRDSILRNLIRGSENIIKEAKQSTDSGKTLAFAEKSIYDISQQNDNSSLSKITEKIPEILDLFEHIQVDKNYQQGLRTGFLGIDDATNGLHKGNLVILAARPAVGKSTLAMNIVENVALRYNATCAVFALEMTRAEIAQRMICSVGGVSNQKATKGQLEPKDWKRLWDAQKMLSDTQIYIDDTSMTTVPDILSKCRRLKAAAGKLDLIVVDHMQIMNAVKSSDSRQQEITEISRGLKMIAKDLDVPVLALSQLRRYDKTGSNQKPALSDLRESGAIEQDADIVMFIHRPDALATPKNGEEINKDEAEIIIAKNRSGPCKTFKLLFKNEQTKFINIVNNYVADPQEGKMSKNENYDNSFSKEPVPITAEGVDDVF